MALILAVSANGPLRGRWGRALAAARHKVRLLSAKEVPGTHRSDESTVCLYDLGESGGASDSALRELIAARPNWRYLAMTAVPSAQEGIRLLRLGVRGYCNRRLSDEALRVAVAAVLAEEVWVGRQVTEYLLGNPPEPQDAAASAPLALDSLTAREREIALLVGAGRSNKVIAADSGISERTVKTHLTAIFRKTGIRNRVQLALAVAQELAPGGQLAHG